MVIQWYMREWAADMEERMKNTSVALAAVIEVRWGLCRQLGAGREWSRLPLKANEGNTCTTDTTIGERERERERKREEEREREGEKWVESKERVRGERRKVIGRVWMHLTMSRRRDVTSQQRDRAEGGEEWRGERERRGGEREDGGVEGRGVEEGWCDVMTDVLVSRSGVTILLCAVNAVWGEEVYVLSLCPLAFHSISA
jgi:hypothetical protein